MYTEQTHDVVYARLNCRVNRAIKARAEEAAAVLGQSITDFTESALAEKAQVVLDENRRILLSERDFARFVAAIESPKEPTEKLKLAWAEYEEFKANNPECNF
ncbi:MAG: DUF1778 domain-containing protein [Fimbriimonas sp.]